MWKGPSIAFQDKRNKIENALCSGGLKGNKIENALCSGGLKGNKQIENALYLAGLGLTQTTSKSIWWLAWRASHMDEILFHAVHRYWVTSCSWGFGDDGTDYQPVTPAGAQPRWKSRQKNEHGLSGKRHMADGQPIKGFGFKRLCIKKLYIRSNFALVILRQTRRSDDMRLHLITNTSQPIYYFMLVYQLKVS